MSILKKHRDKEMHVPESIGIIMDGNGRWAKKRGLPRSIGHNRGAKVFRDIVLYCKDLGVSYVTVYAFSTENWKRPADEIEAIMDLLREYLDKAFNEFKDENVAIKFLGDTSVLPGDISSEIERLSRESAKNDGMVLNVALNYGGRNEIITAIKSIARDFKDGKIDVDNLTEETVSDYLYTKGQPYPDLIIRPSGEQRLSNFLMWQSAYSELWFDKVLWPDFTKKDLLRAFEDYSERNRRYGDIK